MDGHTTDYSLQEAVGSCWFGSSVLSASVNCSVSPALIDDIVVFTPCIQLNSLNSVVPAQLNSGVSSAIPHHMTSSDISSVYVGYEVAPSVAAGDGLTTNGFLQEDTEDHSLRGLDRSASPVLIDNIVSYAPYAQLNSVISSTISIHITSSDIHSAYVGCDIVPSVTVTNLSMEASGILVEEPDLELELLIIQGNRMMERKRFSMWRKWDRFKKKA